MGAFILVCSTLMGFGIISDTRTQVLIDFKATCPQNECFELKLWLDMWAFVYIIYLFILWLLIIMMMMMMCGQVEESIHENLYTSSETRFFLTSVWFVCSSPCIVRFKISKTFWGGRRISISGWKNLILIHHGYSRGN